MRIKRIHHACFLLELGGKIIYFDPFEIPKNAEKADIILAGHDHRDHFQPKSIKHIIKETTIVYAPATCELPKKHGLTKGLYPGDSIKVDSLLIKAVPAYNIGKDYHPKENKWLGFVVSDGNTTIYHSSDTSAIPEMKDLGRINYAFIPIGGKYTMNFEEAIDAVKMIMPNNVIPMHEWEKDTGEFKRLLDEQPLNVNCIVLKDDEMFVTEDMVVI